MYPCFSPCTGPDLHKFCTVQVRVHYDLARLGLLIKLGQVMLHYGTIRVVSVVKELNWFRFHSFLISQVSSLLPLSRRRYLRYTRPCRQHRRRFNSIWALRFQLIPESDELVPDDEPMESVKAYLAWHRLKKSCACAYVSLCIILPCLDLF